MVVYKEIAGKARRYQLVRTSNGVPAPEKVIMAGGIALHMCPSCCMLWRMHRLLPLGSARTVRIMDAPCTCRSAATALRYDVTAAEP